jgi:hypothetical protein
MQLRSRAILNFILSAGSTVTAGTRSRGCYKVYMDEELGIRSCVREEGIFLRDVIGRVFTFLVILALLICKYLLIQGTQEEHKHIL